MPALGREPCRAPPEVTANGPEPVALLRILAVSNGKDGCGGHRPLTWPGSDMSSTDPTTIGVHRALHEALNSAREARHRLDDGDAAPDLDDLVELGKLLAGLSESIMAVNSGMIAKARDARGASA
jgi:hypothetical protein